MEKDQQAQAEQAFEVTQKILREKGGYDEKAVKAAIKRSKELKDIKRDDVWWILNKEYGIDARSLAWAFHNEFEIEKLGVEPKLGSLQKSAHVSVETGSDDKSRGLCC